MCRLKGTAKLILGTYTNLLTILTVQPAIKQVAEQETYIMLHHQLWLMLFIASAGLNRKSFFGTETGRTNIGCVCLQYHFREGIPETWQLGRERS